MVGLTKRQELKVLLGVSRMDKVRNEYIRVLALFKHAHRRDSQQTLMMRTVHEWGHLWECTRTLPNEQAPCFISQRSLCSLLSLWSLVEGWIFFFLNPCFLTLEGKWSTFYTRAEVQVHLFWSLCGSQQLVWSSTQQETILFEKTLSY